METTKRGMAWAPASGGEADGSRGGARMADDGERMVRRCGSKRQRRKGSAHAMLAAPRCHALVVVLLVAACVHGPRIEDAAPAARTPQDDALESVRSTVRKLFVALNEHDAKR